MNIFLTFDYELFFGSDSGTVEKCMLEPTEVLLDLAKGKGVSYTFFVDVGYLITSETYPELKDERSAVISQLKRILDEGHDIQLHIHPHWEGSTWSNGRWSFDTDAHYKLSDFTKEQSEAIVRKYKSYLENIIDRKVEVYRAGGWCIQPFEHVKEVFEETGMRIDSSVIPGDYLETSAYAIDFREAPLKTSYRFSHDVLVEDAEGPFTEYPIAALRYSPLFYWRLYILGRLFPRQHKMIGDGVFLSQGGRKKRKLTQYTVGHVSTDGYYASKLDSGLNKYENLGFQEMVVIGHPKGNTEYSIHALRRFIDTYHNKHHFVTFQKVL